MIARRLLLNRLKVVAPAVATNEIVPVLTHVCFSDGKLLAYNERIAISTPRSSAFRGCIPGALLTDLLRNSRAALVDLAAEGAKVAVILGKSTAKLPMQPVEEFTNIFAMPSMPPKQNALNGIAGKFFSGIEHCLQSVEENSTVPDKLGVTVIPNGKEVELIATNSITLNRATVPLPADNGIEQRVILATDFCREMLHLAKQARVIRLAIENEHALFSADDTLLFGKLIVTDQPLDYDRAVANNLPRHYRKQLVPIPRQFAALLRRLVLISNVGYEPHTEISIADGVATFRVKSRLGEITETLALRGHPDVKARVQMSNLHQGYAALAPEKILFTERCVILARGDLLRLVSANVTRE
jgi:DNA polymerase III sliding clamp (beta) subunit (PCNA family)